MLDTDNHTINHFCHNQCLSLEQLLSLLSLTFGLYYWALCSTSVAILPIHLAHLLLLLRPSSLLVSPAPRSATKGPDHDLFSLVQRFLPWVCLEFFQRPFLPLSLLSGPQNAEGMTAGAWFCGCAHGSLRTSIVDIKAGLALSPSFCCMESIGLM